MFSLCSISSLMTMMIEKKRMKHLTEEGRGEREQEERWSGI